MDTEICRDENQKTHETIVLQDTDSNHQQAKETNNFYIAT